MVVSDLPDVLSGRQSQQAQQYISTRGREGGVNVIAQRSIGTRGGGVVRVYNVPRGGGAPQRVYIGPVEGPKPVEQKIIKPVSGLSPRAQELAQQIRERTGPSLADGLNLFDLRKAQVSARLANEGEKLQTELDSTSADRQAEAQALNNEIERYNQTGQGDPRALSERVSSFNRKVADDTKTINAKVEEFNAKVEAAQKMKTYEFKPTIPIGRTNVVRPEERMARSLDVKKVDFQPKAPPRVQPMDDPVKVIGQNVAEQQAATRGLFGKYTSPVVAYSVGGSLGLQTGTALGIIDVASRAAGSGAYFLTGSEVIKGVFEFAAPFALGPRPKITPSQTAVKTAMGGVETRFAGFGKYSSVGNKTYYSLRDLEIIATPRSQQAIQVFGKEPIRYSLFGKGQLTSAGQFEVSTFAGTFGETGVAGAQRGVFVESVTMQRGASKVPLIGKSTGLEESVVIQQRGFYSPTTFSGNFFGAKSVSTKGTEIVPLQQSIMVRPAYRSYNVAGEIQPFENISLSTRQTLKAGKFELAQQKTLLEYDLATDSFYPRNTYGEILFGPRQPVSPARLGSAKPAGLLTDSGSYFVFKTESPTGLNELFKPVFPAAPLASSQVSPVVGSIVRQTGGTLLVQRAVQTAKVAQAVRVSSSAAVSLTKPITYDIQGSAKSLGVQAGEKQLSKQMPIQTNAPAQIEFRPQKINLPSISNIVSPVQEKPSVTPAMGFGKVVIPAVNLGIGISSGIIQESESGQLFRQGSSQGQAQSFVQKPISRTITSTVTVPQIGVPNFPQPRINIPKTPKIPRGKKKPFFEEFSESRSVRPAFTVLGRRRGKTFVLGSGLPFGRATSVGVGFARTTLGRSFKIVQTGTTGMSDIAARIPSDVFRPARSKALAGFQVQKSRYALSSPLERMEIKQARKRRLF